MGEVCWCVILCDLLAGCSCLRAWAGCWLGLPRFCLSFMFSCVLWLYKIGFSSRTCILTTQRGWLTLRFGRIAFLQIAVCGHCRRDHTHVNSKTFTQLWLLNTFFLILVSFLCPKYPSFFGVWQSWVCEPLSKSNIKMISGGWVKIQHFITV